MVEQSDKSAVSTKARKADSSQISKPSVNKQTNKPPLILIVTIVLLLGAVVLALIRNSSEPSLLDDSVAVVAFADTVIDNLQQNNCAKAYEVTSESFKTNTTLEEWEKDCSDASTVLTGDPVYLEEVEDINPTDEVAEVYYKILATDDLNYIAVVYVAEENGQLVLNGISSRPDTENQIQ